MKAEQHTRTEEGYIDDGCGVALLLEPPLPSVRWYIAVAGERAAAAPLCSAHDSARVLVG